MRNKERYEEQSEGSRIGKRAAVSGAAGALTKYLQGQGGHAMGLHAGLGALTAGAGQGIGDAIMGQPKEHGFMEEAKRGALGGAIAGAPGGFIGAGMSQHGAPLVHYLMKMGLGKKAALALALGGGALAGSAAGAVSGGLDSGLLNYEPEEK